MDFPISRRGLLQAAALAPCLLPAEPPSAAAAGHRADGRVHGRMSGARALAETLRAEGTLCVFGIPGAQENELWDAFKSSGLPYLLATHEFSAATMADGCARSTGRPGVLCVVPGPGVTNSLSGLGEALLDSVPVVAIVGDVANGDKAHAFQVHSLNQYALLQPVTKGVCCVRQVGEIPAAIRQAFALAMSGEPGPVAVVIPYNLLIEVHDFDSSPLGPPTVSFDEAAFACAVRLLADRRLRVGIYAGQGCMDFGPLLTQTAELLQAPVATSVSGKGAICEAHPLAVGWGYGPQGTHTAEAAFAHVDLTLAIGVKYSEVSTGFYSDPQTRHLIHVDACADNLGRVMRTDVAVHADAGLFLQRLLTHADCLRRPPDAALLGRLRQAKTVERGAWSVEREEKDGFGFHAPRATRHAPRSSGIDPMALVLALRRCLPEDGMLFVDVTVSEHLAAEAYTVVRPRTYFNPTDNQAMGWSIPAAIGAQRVQPGRATATLTGDGCFLMSAMEVSTAARVGLPVKFFVLDDRAYHYMQMLQRPAYLRTTATILARLDYAALAHGFGVAYQEILSTGQVEAGVRQAMCQPGPVLVRVATDYGNRHIRWIDAARKRYTAELSARQKARFLARIGSRAVEFHHDND